MQSIRQQIQASRNFADGSWPDLGFGSNIFVRFLILICNSRRSFCAGFHRLRIVADASHSAISDLRRVTQNCAFLRRKIFGP
jgi:hypothetical protein